MSLQSSNCSHGNNNKKYKTILLVSTIGALAVIVYLNIYSWTNLKTVFLATNNHNTNIHNNTIAIADVLKVQKFVHIFFTTYKGQALNEKVVFALQSALVTQRNTAIILWTEHFSLDTITKQVNKLARDFACGAGTTIEVRLLTELRQQLELSTDAVINKNHCALPAEGSAVANSDLFRFLVLFFYGGIYVDADTLFLKDLGPFHGLSFAFKWGGGGDPGPNWYTHPMVAGFNTAVMGLPRGSPIPAKIAKDRCTPASFHPTEIARKLACADPDTECIGFAMMPTFLFDPIQSYHVGDHKFRDISKAHPGNMEGFFDRPSLFKDVDNVFPGAFLYHWHNRWHLKTHPESVYSQLKTKLSKCPATI